MDKNTATLLALFTLGSFGVQQLLQILDWMVVWFIATIKTKLGLPGGMAEADFKKSLMPTIGFVLGLIFVRWADIGLLKLLPSSTLLAIASPPGDANGVAWPDSLLTALAISAGTDGVNTVLKFIGYVKDARKPQ